MIKDMASFLGIMAACIAICVLVDVSPWWLIAAYWFFVAAYWRRRK